jgi:hypothetical protein
MTQRSYCRRKVSVQNGLFLFPAASSFARTQRTDFSRQGGSPPTWQEALQSVIRNTLTTALTPTINALSVTGIVHIPGMMTGQILAGQSPFQAAAYQVLIFFLIRFSYD